MTKSALAFDYVDQKSRHAFHFTIAVFKKPRNDKEYSKLQKLLDKLIDTVRGNEKHPLALVMQIIGENLEQYDNEHYLAIGNHVNEIEFIKYLMKTRNLHQNDLADIFGGQANVSKYLNGERPLSKKQIIGLKDKFNISADVFLSNCRVD